MTSFICRKCGTSVKTYSNAHRIAQCRGCKQWYEVDRNGEFTITPCNQFNDKSSVPDSIRAMKDKIVGYLDSQTHINSIVFGPDNIYPTAKANGRTPALRQLHTALSAWMGMRVKESDWRIDGYVIKRHNDSNPFKYVAVRV